MESAKNLREAREAAGLTQQQLGEACGYAGAQAQIYVARWESGARPIPRTKIAEVATLLKIEIQKLL